MPRAADTEDAIAKATAPYSHIVGPFVVTQINLETLRSRVVAGPFDTLEEAHRRCRRHDGKYLAMVDLARAFPPRKAKAR